MAQPKGTSGEAIGRPGPWGEDRYEKKDQPIDQSVRTPPATAPYVEKPPSTAVTRRDYAAPSTQSSSQTTPANDADAPGGDAG
jgi:hypothetical protein